MFIDPKALLQKRWTELAVIEKAVVLSSTGGQLAPEDADAFISSVVDKASFLNEVTVKRMVASTAYIDVFAIATRQMTAAVEATIAATAQTVNFSLTIPRRTLTPVEVILAPDVSYTFLSENIERAAAEAHLMGEITKSVRNDMLDLCVNGDGSTGTFLAINTGWVTLALADSAVNDADCAGLDAIAAMDKVLDTLPEKYDGMPDQAFCVSRKFRRKYGQEVAARETMLGDKALSQAGDISFEGIPLKSIYSWPTAYVMLTPKSNLHIGISKVITVEKMLQPRKQIIEYTITLKFDPEYAYGGFISLGANVSV